MASIKNDITKGVFWIAIAKYSGIVVQLLISAILARLISPAAFGTITVAMVVLHFLNIFADIGIGAAVVQFKQLTKSHLDSLFTLNIYIGIGLAAILYLSSGHISSYYGDSTLIHVCQLTSLVILFNSLNVVPNALMRKDKRFRTIALRTLFFQVLSGGIAVWGAFHDWGIYALLVAPVLTAIGVFVVNYYNYPLHAVARIEKEAVNTVASYSVFQFAFAFCNYFSRNLDKLIIGKFFNLTQLGYYDKSYHLMQLPLQNLTFVIEPVLHPVLSTLQDNKHELAEKNRKLAVLISYISFPIGLMLYFCGGELIRIIYGSQWDAAIPVFKILALSLPLQMILSISGAIYQAAGRTNHMFYNGILNTSVTVAGFLAAAYWGGTIEAMAWAWDITLAVNFISTYFILCGISLKYRPLSFYKAIVPQFLNSVLVFFAMAICCHWVVGANIFVSLIVKALLIMILTVMVAELFQQYHARDILNYSISRK